jgi:DNA-binding HxlR family transcriptional regulator
LVEGSNPSGPTKSLVPRQRLGVARPLDAIGDGWPLLIVRDAFDGLRRFGKFQKSLGLAKNIRAVRLRNLLEHGVFELAPAFGSSGWYLI